MIDLWPLFVFGLLTGAVLTAILPFPILLLRPEDFQRRSPNRSYTRAIVVWALIDGLVIGVTVTGVDYLFERELAWNGAVIGVGWGVGAVLGVVFKLSGLKRT